MSQYDDYPYYIGIGMVSLMSLLVLATLALLLTKHKCISCFYGFFLLLLFIVTLAIGGGFIWAKS